MAVEVGSVCGVFLTCCWLSKRHVLRTDEPNAVMSLKSSIMRVGTICCLHRNFYATGLCECILVVSLMKCPSSLTLSALDLRSYVPYQNERLILFGVVFSWSSSAASTQ